ncbi:MAG TPA: hypothetical protein VK638_48735 [Edaphobacter sp.]|nr:hypothetical protein [Edaphobacter sp.]
MTISDGEGGKTDFWTKVPDLESSRKQRRYFHPMSASGARESFPHISETQRRNKEPTHLTDISGKQWSRDDLNGRAPSGTYPTKTHLNLEPNPSAGPNAAKVSKEANHAILTDPRNQKQPTKQNKVFVKEGDVHVDYTQLQKFKQGRASAGSQEVLSPKQEKQTFAEVKDRWTGKDVIAIDKPKSD